MLGFNFQRIFRARGIDRPFSFLVKAGYSANFATRIANNRVERLNLPDVERICVLLQCTPNDLLQWFPESNDKTNDKHPLISLKRSNTAVHITQLLKNVPLDKLNDIENVIRKEIENENNNR